jgi:hypothetical protein
MFNYLNSVVVIDSIAVPGLATAVNDPLKYIRLCDISDNVYDTERRGNHNPIIHISKTVGYVEFEVTLAVSSIITSNVG